MIVKELSKFILNLNYYDIPKTAIKQAKLCFLDFLGVTKRGFHEESTQIAMKSMEIFNNFNRDFDNKKSSIIGGAYSNIANASFINGISAHCLDLDDGHRFAQLHPGCVVFPTAVAIAEANNIDGRKFLEAVVCGYEIAIVLGILASPNHRNQGFHSTGTIGTFAATSVASKLLNLSLKETINALGICGTQSSGFLEVDHQGTMGKQLHAGKAVYNGILSGYLAKNGFKGPESIVDGDEGFLKAMSIDFFKDLNENKNFKDLNEKGIDFIDYLSSYLEESIGKFHINEVYFKKYPFCRHIHSSIDATLNINSKFDFDIEDIERIIVKTYKIATEHNNFNPKNNEEIKQSLPYAVAVAIVENSLNLDLFENNNNNINNTNNNLNYIINKDNNKDNNNFNNNCSSKYNNNYNNEDNNNFKNKYNNKYNDINFKNVLMKDILDKIVIEENEEFTKLTPKYRPSKVIIKTNNGIYEDFVKLPLGESENPLSKKDILEKFKNINLNSFDLEKLAYIDSCIDNIEDYNISEVMKNFHNI